MAKKASNNLRQIQAFQLMSLSASAKSNYDFANEVDQLGFKMLPNYSHGDLSKPRFCCTTVQSKENPKEVFLLNRGLPWEKMNFWGILEELPDILAATRSQRPEDTRFLKKKLYDIQRDKDLEEITVIGHSRGALIVDHTADIPELLSSEHTSVLTISAESPGVSWLEVKNPSYVQYISDFHSIINACGTPSSKEVIAIKNTPEDIRGKGFLEVSFEAHGIDSLLANFYNQEALPKRPACFSYAYQDFLEKGGKATIPAALAVKAGNVVKNMSAIPSIMCDLLVESVRPNSYAPPGEWDSFWGDWAEICLMGLAMELLF